MTIFSSTNSAPVIKVKKKMARPSFKKSDVDEKLIIKTGIQATGNEHEKRENEKWEQIKTYLEQIEPILSSLLIKLCSPLRLIPTRWKDRAHGY